MQFYCDALLHDRLRALLPPELLDSPLAVVQLEMSDPATGKTNYDRVREIVDQEYLTGRPILLLGLAPLHDYQSHAMWKPYQVGSGRCAFVQLPKDRNQIVEKIRQLTKLTTSTE